MRAMMMVGLMLAANAYAADEYKFVPPSQEYKLIPSGTYFADPSHSSVTFRIMHMGMSHFTGRFNNVSATLTYDAKDPAAAKLTAAVPTAAVDTANPVLDDKLKSAQFFDAATYPAISLVARNVEITGPTSGKLLAEVTAHGKTVPVVFDLAFNGYGKNFEGKDSFGFSARGVLKMADIGMGAFAGPLGDNVELWLEAEFNRK